MYVCVFGGATANGNLNILLPTPIGSIARETKIKDTLVPRLSLVSGSSTLTRAAIHKLHGLRPGRAACTAVSDWKREDYAFIMPRKERKRVWKRHGETCRKREPLEPFRSGLARRTYYTTHTHTYTQTSSAHAGRGALKPCAPVVVGWPAYVSRSAIAASLGCLGVFPT